MNLLRYLATTCLVIIFATLTLFHADIVNSIKAKIPDYQIKTVEIKPKPIKKNKPKTETHLTLDNKKIDNLLSQQAASLKRCHQNRIAEVGPLKGLVLLGVTIMPTGSVANVSLLKSNMNDPLLVQCLARVLERVKFPKYNGGPKQRAFPIEFQ